ncbi:2-succinyl-5-enolpyruvyl-6-hydroxy-3-cyclohexene-1-carboxylic-acid synthase [Proteus mirabilis]|uniref:2-succinyl-5-enolpyruvyl-6-hydroxy-3- cyclohexene-1-carboxylic-acid synthase n=1 Tax=Proteus mirabilis TaxID=584 RepID=UPI00073CB5A3|nr:2-succinyl-5-enolpyruvyl-6-hydroxy-3-cyclohexene-1-carboxylic-acid synthase [Proteus mirabilis]ELB0940973.1 2-succinyl-5-enolpyruvyl-6-hydroxy-3-cyclohexene-1-carboxylic-acid synthase [Proteus mirabilis]KSW18022.1 2-succinyl-5-enolpyruvyl-6-hydroxy-3-cyclohexene-1-carboxylate synthase [Proteus mirabilis]MBC6386878.1 2-succinyl-5-enolpyruvyl-6-hydroxy-3-cyclohexene-1-carboxylic-acid synthase [Proteus mirabilis]MBG2759703.1 2-succinyl-5-enolpyruvyl-6-hydroxy-3-cyclohexene-1-carboxylic-acid syn
MSNSSFNRQWAKVILETLTRHGLRHICIAPGSRSTPLTLAAAANHKLICHTHFDERGLGHLALGLAKATQQPVAVIVTSGTAVANLYPALIEAGLTGERVIFLTADRPPELINCGANQAIRQQGIFASHPSETLSLPRPTADIPARWLVSTLDNAMNNLVHGALHVNCPFAEPLYGDDIEHDTPWTQALGKWWQSDKPWLQETLSPSVTTHPQWDRLRQKKGVVIAGRISAKEGIAVAKWVSQLGWPLLGDVLSQTGQPLPCADLWLNNPQVKAELNQAEIVIQFGSSLTGKRLLQWQANCSPQMYWVIDAIPGRLDPGHHQGEKFTLSPSQWLTAHPAIDNLPWALSLSHIATQTYQHVTEVTDYFGEAQVAHQLDHLLPYNGQLFVGNSLIVRLIDAFAQLPQGYPVMSNRGASGIDGLLSTSAGVHRATQKPTLTILGDLSALYDLNSFALHQQVYAPNVVIIVNNNGGQIFSMLPTPMAERERFYCMPHALNFKHAAAMFGLDYVAPNCWDDLFTTVTACWQGEAKTTLIELIVNETEGAETLNQLVKQVTAYDFSL